MNPQTQAELANEMSAENAALHSASVSPTEPGSLPPPSPSLPLRSAAGEIGFSLSGRFFLWLSKTDLSVAWRVASPETVMTQQAIGAMVLNTGIFAFISVYYAVSTTFFYKSSDSALLPVLIALFYGSAIMLVDREIVSSNLASHNWKSYASVAFRIAFSIFLGIVLAKPMELKVLEGAISEQVAKDMQIVHEDKLKKIDELEQWKEKWESEQKNPIKLQLEILGDAFRTKDEQARLEGEKQECGIKCKNLETDRAKIKSEMDGLKAELATVDDKIHYLKDPELQRKEEDKNQLRDELVKDEEKAQADFLTRFRALHNITHPRLEEKMKSEGASTIVLGIQIVFVLFELLPVLIKLLMDKNEYQTYTSCRREIAMQKMHVLTNEALKQIKMDPYNANLNEFSRRLENAAENPSYHSRPPSVFVMLKRRLSEVASIGKSK